MSAPILARLLSPAEFGLWSLFTSMLFMLSSVAAFRYDLAILLPSNDSVSRSVLRLSAWLATCSSIAVALVIAVFGDIIAAEMNAPNLADWLYLLAPAVFLVSQYQILTFWLNRSLKYRAISGAKVLQSLTQTPVQVALANAGGGAGALIAGSLVGYATAFGLSLYRAAPSLRTVDRGPALPVVAKRYWKMPAWNGPNALADAIRLNGVNLAIGALYGQSFLGQYALGWRTVQMPLSLINGALSQLYFQRLSVTPRGSMRRSLNRMVGLSACLGVIPFSLLFIFGEPTFAAIFGETWSEAGRIAAIFAPWLYLNFITSPVSTLFLVTERQLLLLVFSIIYMACPFIVLFACSAGGRPELGILSGAMSAMLVLFLLIASSVARRYDAE